MGRRISYRAMRADQIVLMSTRAAVGVISHMGLLADVRNIGIRSVVVSELGTFQACLFDLGGDGLT